MIMKNKTAWFGEKIIDWYSIHKRDLPWRNTRNPYKIWLSEIILQQTRVEQGLPYYYNFIQTFPDVASLANASEEKVLRTWQGLGYYSRAKNLHASAKWVFFENKGNFPNTFKELKKLKGVGDYTAAAIASFAFKEVVPVVDGNVFRVLSRVFNDNTNISSANGFQHFFALALQLIDTNNPDIFNQAIMEFGALHCTPKNPNCGLCPLNNSCVAFQKNTLFSLPFKASKTKVKAKYLHYFLFSFENKLLLQKRDDSSIWKGLYEFPHITFETNQLLEASHLHTLSHDLNLENIDLQKLTQLGKMRKHQLSHLTLYAHFYMVNLDKESLNMYHSDEIQQLPKPVLIDKILHEYYF